MDKKIFKDFDFSNFWQDINSLICLNALPTDEQIKSAERELGYKLPNSYIELMKLHNGGIPENRCFPTNKPTSWADDHVSISSIHGVTDLDNSGIVSETRLMIEEWGYPDIGVCICDCPSAGHDIIMLDYSNCGNEGEPEVVHIDCNDGDFDKTFLAKNFEIFIRGLVHVHIYSPDE